MFRPFWSRQRLAKHWLNPTSFASSKAGAMISPPSCSAQMPCGHRPMATASVLSSTGTSTTPTFVTSNASSARFPRASCRKICVADPTIYPMKRSPDALKKPGNAVQQKSACKVVFTRNTQARPTSTLCARLRPQSPTCMSTRSRRWRFGKAPPPWALRWANICSNSRT